MAQAVAAHHAGGGQAPGNLPWVSFSSAGTHAGLAGAPCDPRAKAALKRRGYEATKDVCRRITDQDFERFDLILAMDGANLAYLQKHCPAEHRHKVRLFLDFAEGISEKEIPDPYYGDSKGFDRVLELCEAGAVGLLKQLRSGR